MSERFQFLVVHTLDDTTAGDVGYRFDSYYYQIGLRFWTGSTTHF